MSTSRVLFFVESALTSEKDKLELHPFFHRFRRTRIPDFLADAGFPEPWYGFGNASRTPPAYRDEKWQPIDEAGEVERFSILQVRKDIKTYGTMFAEGFVPVNFDLFHFHRSFLLYHEQTVGISGALGADRMVRILKKDIFEAHFFAGTILKDEGVRKDIDNVVAHMEKTDADTQTQMNSDPVKETNLVNQYNERFRLAIRGKRLPTCYLWMLHLTRWVANFTMDLIERKTNQIGLHDDMASMKNELVSLISQQNKEAYPHHFLDTFSMCGDAVAYLLFIKPRMSALYANDVCVLYAGDTHATRISEWIRHTSYTEDFELVSRLY